MTDIRISDLPVAGVLDGLELVKLTTQQIAGLVTKASLRLDKVDNTADVDKPLSTAQAAAIARSSAPPLDLSGFIRKDGTVDMDPGYTPPNKQSVATKFYADNLKINLKVGSY